MTVSASQAEERYFIPQVPAPWSGPDGPISLLSQFQLMRLVLKNPIETFADFHYEQPVSQFKMFGVPNILINDPEMIRYCFIENAANYKHSYVRQSILKPALGEGLLTAEGEQWKKGRKLLAPLFTPAHVHSFTERMRERTESFLTELEGHHSPVSIAEEMSRLTYLILSDTLFSGEISEDTEAMTQAVGKFLKDLGRPDPFDLMRLPAWLPRLTKLRGQSSLKYFRSTVVKAIKSRMQTIDKGLQAPDDFLTLLLTARDEDSMLMQKEVEDNILTFITAGHETTARGLAWLLYLLSQAQDYLHKVEAEIDALDMNTIPAAQWIEHMPWTLACFEEAMRLYPPAVILSREPLKEDQFKEYNIPLGCRVMVVTWVLHRHRMLWENPERFEPERFMGEERQKINRFAYLPFGLGPRVCIGAKFAMQEAIIILAVLLKKFRFEYAGNAAPLPVLKVTLQPENAMPMWVRSRG